jgi:hypothetical protein
MRHRWISPLLEMKKRRQGHVMKAAQAVNGEFPHRAHREREVRISQSHIGRAPSTTEHVRDQAIIHVGSLTAAKTKGGL